MYIRYKHGGEIFIYPFMHLYGTSLHHEVKKSLCEFPGE